MRARIRGDSTDEGTLLCPNGGENLHQESIEYFDRREDADTGLHVFAERGKQLLVNEDMRGNPSSRRQGIKIRFSCEHCRDTTHVLNIVQHKGVTYVSWDVESEGF